jgi:hypothetical protein
MLSQITEKLLQARERLRARRKLEAMRAEARDLLEQEQRKRYAHERRLAAEKADVDKLEGFSLTGMFYTVLGTKKEHLAKERQEFLAAKLKRDEAVEAVRDAQQEVERLQNELSAFDGAEAEYERLVEEKHRLLVEAGDSRAETLLGYDERLADLAAEGKELREAIRAGEAALDALGRVSGELRSAENWGTWDMLGGGTFVTMAKHSRIDTARQYAHTAQSYLRRFKEELADAGQRLNLSLNIGGFSTFADYFFDGLIADWVVQSKIQQSSSACYSATSQVHAALAECRRRQAEVEQDTEAVSEERRRLVEQA